MTVSSTPNASLRLSVHDERLAVCRLDSRAEIPAWATIASFFSVTRTNGELSVVCPADHVPNGVRCERSWRAFELEGPFDFSEVGVLTSVAAPLTQAGISIFALSTYDTDYVLVGEDALDGGVAALRESGHEVRVTNVAVRPAAADDEPFLWETLYEAVHRGSEEPGPKPPPKELLAEPGIRRYLAGWGREGDFAVVARDSADGRRVGAAWYRLFPASDPGYGFVDTATPDIAIAVVPDRRGTGVGGILLRALMDAARSNGFDAMSLSVQKSNHAATKLYEKNGFARFRDDGDAWVMKAELSAEESSD